MKLKNILIGLLGATSLVMAIFNVPRAFAANNPEADIMQANNVQTEIQITDFSAKKSGNNLEVSAVLFNPNSNIGTPPFTHLLMLENINPLFGGNGEILPPPLVVSAQEGTSYFSLKPREKKSVSYTLPMGRYLPKNNYRAILSFILPSGESLGEFNDVVFDLGDNEEKKGIHDEPFVDFNQETCKVIDKSGEEYSENSGPLFNPGEAPMISCSIKNVSSKTATVYPSVEWKEFYVYGKPSSGQKLSLKAEQSVTLKPQEVKVFKFELPKAQKPQVYQALVSFVDGIGAARSYQMPFRWTITGSSARIESVSLAKDTLRSNYNKRETVSLSVNYFGSMDLYWRDLKKGTTPLSQLKMTAVIKDAQGDMCGRQEDVIDDISDSRVKNRQISVVLDKDCRGMVYDVSLSQNDNNLASEQGQAPVLEVKNNSSLILKILVLVIVVIVAYLLSVVFLKKNRKIANAVFVAGLLLVSNFVYSVTTVIYPDDAGKTVNNGFVEGGTVSSSAGGVIWTGRTLPLKSGYEQGDGSYNDHDRYMMLQVTSVDFRNSGRSITLRDTIDGFFAACDNYYAGVRVRLFAERPSGERNQVVMRIRGARAPYLTTFFLPRNRNSRNLSNTYEIESSDAGILYDSEGNLRKDIKLVVEYRAGMLHGKGDHLYYGQINIQDGHKEGRFRWNDVFASSDVLSVKIPASLSEDENSSSSMSSSSLSSFSSTSSSSDDNGGGDGGGRGGGGDDGGGSNQSASSSSSLDISGGGGGDFSLIAPEIVKVIINNNSDDFVKRDIKIDVEPRGGFNGAVVLSVEAGFAYDLLPDGTIDSTEYFPTGTGSTLSLRISRDTEPRDYNVVVTGDSGDLSREKTIILRIERSSSNWQPF